MKVRRRIKGALASFLNTYISRYTDLNGYWLFGQLLVEVFETDLTILSDSSQLPDLPISRTCHDIREKEAFRTTRQAPHSETVRERDECKNRKKRRTLRLDRTPSCQRLLGKARR